MDECISLLRGVSVYVYMVKHHAHTHMYECISLLPGVSVCVYMVEHHAHTHMYECYTQTEGVHVISVDKLLRYIETILSTSN